MVGKSLFAVLFVALFAMSCAAAEIRVRNASGVDFTGVVVGDKSYGDVKSGESTKHQTWKTAYRYSSVKLMAEGKPYSIQPIDYVGEKTLGEGQYTYVITLKDGQLQINAEPDKK